MRQSTNNNMKILYIYIHTYTLIYVFVNSRLIVVAALDMVIIKSNTSTISPVYLAPRSEVWGKTLANSHIFPP